MVVELRQSGYNPVLTHSEKNRFLHSNLAQFFELRSAGCLFHIGMDSLLQEERNPLHVVSHWLVRNQMADFVGTNFSAPQQFDRLQQLSETELTSLNLLIRKNIAFNKKRNEPAPF